MLIGSAGTGKTSLVQSFLRDNASESLLSCTINTSFYTDAAAMQRQLEQPLDKVRRTRIAQPTATGAVLQYSRGGFAFTGGNLRLRCHPVSLGPMFLLHVILRSMPNASDRVPLAPGSLQRFLKDPMFSAV